MTREEAKDLFRNDKDAYGKPRAIMHKIDQIFDAFENPPPPAEGAEEILEKYMQGNQSISMEGKKSRRVAFGSAIRAMREFATLHAQRLAEKMVEEKLIEFGNMIRDEPNGDIPALAEYFMRTINLKSKEQ